MRSRQHPYLIGGILWKACLRVNQIDVHYSPSTHTARGSLARADIAERSSNFPFAGASSN
jgi:hypothetical protein